MMKKFLFVFSVLFIFSISAYAQQDTSKAGGQQAMDPQAAKYYNSAIEKMKAGNYQEAITSLDSSLQVSKDYRTYFLKGQALVKTGNLQDARTAFQSSVSMDSTYEPSLYALANADLGLKNYGEAIYYYKKVSGMTKDPKMKNDADSGAKLAQQNEAIDLYNKGNELQKANKYDDAVKSYDQSLAITPDYRTYYQKGLALSKLNREDDAIQSLNQAIAAKDSFDLAYVALGGLLTTKKDYAGALKSYEKALAVTTNDNLKSGIQEGITRTYLVLGNQYVKEKKYDKAIETFKKAAESTNSDQAYLGLAKAYIDKKQYNDALAALQNADKNKKTVTAGAIAFYTGVVNYEKGDKAKALESFKAASEDATYKKASQSYITRINAEKGQAPAKK